MNARTPQALQQAMSLQKSGRIAEARALCEGLHAADPRDFDSVYLLGMLAAQAGDLPAAIDAFEKAADLRPAFADARYNLAVALNMTGRHSQAVEAYARVLDVAPRHLNALMNLGASLTAAGRLADALAACEKALVLSPDHVGALANRGDALRRLNRFEEALRDFNRALKLKPDFAGALTNRGLLFAALGRADEAIADHHKAIALQKNNPDAHFNLAGALNGARRPDEAAASFATAFSLKPAMDFLEGALLNARMKICDWRDFDARLASILARIGRGERAAAPFETLAFTESRATQREAAAIWATHGYPRHAPRPPARPGEAGRKLRIGYFSADFQIHATMFLMISVFERTDRTQFEIFGFSLAPPTGDAMEARARAACDGWLDVSGESDDAIAARARDLGIDIVVDLKGYTSQSRPGLFAAGAASVQMSFLGYPGTMGAPFMDYLVADSIVVPPAHRGDYDEKIIAMPGSYQCVSYGDLDLSGGAPPTRAEHGLPDQGFVFCCFNNNYKITPAVFALWTRVLRAVVGSVLWLFEDNAAASRNLRVEATKAGIDPVRLVFAPRVPFSEHLRRHALADLFLDTAPYCAHTTATDCLWAGVPLVTRRTEAFAGRVAASLLTATGLPELIATNETEYEELAIDLARDPARLGALRARLATARTTSPLFDIAAFARDLEQAFRVAHARAAAGERPDHFSVGQAARAS